MDVFIDGNNVGTIYNVTTPGSAVSRTVSAGAHIIDEAVSANGRFLYVIADRTGQVYGFRIESDGSLTALGAVDGLPAGNGGLAAS